MISSIDTYLTEVIGLTTTRFVEDLKYFLKISIRLHGRDEVIKWCKNPKGYNKTLDNMAYKYNVVKADVKHKLVKA